MCGIVSIVDFGPELTGSGEAKLSAMLDAIKHRGPDGQGTIVHKHAALGMCRLSIIDLASGQQPISNEDGTLWIVFNGEIYNYRELRLTLTRLGHVFKTKSDTEVILHAFEEFGEDCLRYLNGMFAFVIWDERRQRLFGARDRLGIKPLYYARIGDSRLLISSELKGILAAKELGHSLDLISINQYLSFEYVPAPRTIYRDVSKLPAGNCFTFSNLGFNQRPYWNVSFARSETRPPCTWHDFADNLYSRLEDAVQMELVSDVPLGVLLSGGLDSSTVASILAGQGAKNRQVEHSFSVALEDPSFDESKYARSTAAFLGLTHHELLLTNQAIADFVPELGKYLDEPLGDSSFIPTFFLSKFAREHVKVVLGGDGGDELFGGYPTLQANQLVNYYEKLLPYFVRARIVPAIVSMLPSSPKNVSFDFKARRFLSGRGLPLEIRHHKWLGSFSDEEKRQLLKQDAQLSEFDTYQIVREYLQTSDARDSVNKLLYCDLKLYLEGDILTKVDRASMANSLEVRVPLLNARVLDYALTIPHYFKIRGMTAKYILKKTMEHRLPREIVYRQKKGFNIPIATLLRTKLRDMTYDLLGPQAIERQGLFNSKYVSTLLEEHMSGRLDHRKLLWTLLSFQIWHAENAV